MGGGRKYGTGKVTGLVGKKKKKKQSKKKNIAEVYVGFAATVRRSPPPLPYNAPRALTSLITHINNTATTVR
jgi:hypothetical protein